MALTRRQKQIFDYINEFIERHGFSPSLEEIGRHFGLSSVATVHKHVTNLVRKGLLRRSWNQNRSIEVVKDDEAPRAVEIPLLGRIVGDRPVEGMDSRERLSVPSWLVGHGRTYALIAEGDALLDEQIRSGDVVIIEERRHFGDDQLAVILVHGEEPRLCRLRADAGQLRLGRGESARLAPRDGVEVRGVVRGVLRRC
ncbi:MAG: S24 family peptidase [Acidobacteriota bacterium]|nr:S24 family peptidase [Acidobacteriota bacterium]MDQ7088724.1 S24 family peptidase [Acidobacteriota bacterium]